MQILNTSLIIQLFETDVHYFFPYSVFSMTDVKRLAVMLTYLLFILSSSSEHDFKVPFNYELF